MMIQLLFWKQTEMGEELDRALNLIPGYPIPVVGDSIQYKDGITRMIIDRAIRYYSETQCSVSLLGEVMLERNDPSSFGIDQTITQPSNHIG